MALYWLRDAILFERQVKPKNCQMSASSKASEGSEFWNHFKWRHQEPKEILIG